MFPSSKGHCPLFPHLLMADFLGAVLLQESKAPGDDKATQANAISINQKVISFARNSLEIVGFFSVKAAE